MIHYAEHRLVVTLYSEVTYSSEVYREEGLTIVHKDTTFTYIIKIRITGDLYRCKSEHRTCYATTTTAVITAHTLTHTHTHTHTHTRARTYLSIIATHTTRHKCNSRTHPYVYTVRTTLIVIYQ